MLKTWLILWVALFGGALLGAPAHAAKDKGDREDIPEEGWYCVPDPADGGWACGIGEEPPISAAVPPAGVRPREDYTPEVTPLPDLAGQPPPAEPESDDSLFGSRPLTAADGPATVEPGATDEASTTDAAASGPEPADETPTATTTAAEPEPADQTPIADAAAAEPEPDPVETPQPSTGDYVIQLVGARDPANIDAFVERHQLEGQVIRRQTWLYSEAWYVVLMGPYPDYDTANLVLERLPEGLLSAGPFVRTLSDLD